MTGPRSYEDRQEGCQADHREILHSIDFGFPHQQAYLWGNCYHSQQTIEEQDCWVSLLNMNTIFIFIINFPVVFWWQVCDPFDETSAAQDGSRYQH